MFQFQQASLWEIYNEFILPRLEVLSKVTALIRASAVD